MPQTMCYGSWHLVDLKEKHGGEVDTQISEVVVLSTF